MNEQQYFDRLRELEALHNTAIYRLGMEYVRATAKHRVGDLVRDLHGKNIIIRVEQISIQWNSHGRPPEPKYIGRLCKIDGTETRGDKSDATWEHRCEAYVPKTKAQKVLGHQFRIRSSPKTTSWHCPGSWESLPKPQNCPRRPI